MRLGCFLLGTVILIFLSGCAEMNGVAEGKLVRTANGQVHPAPGFVWVHPNDPNDLSVRTQVEQDEADGKLVSTANGQVHPAPGYVWVHPNDPNDLSVVAAATPAPAPQAAGAGDPSSALSDSLVACYEIIRFVIVEAAGKDGEDLKALAPRFSELKTVYQTGRARMGSLDLAGMPNTGRSLTKGFQPLDAAFQRLGSAFVAGSREQLIGELVAARYQIQDLQETLGALADNRPPSRAEPAPPAPAHFNTLTHLLVDPATGRVTFYGSDDPAGPRQAIPYAQFFAAALRLPDESGTPGVTGSIPGFSLEPVQDMGAVYASLVDTLNTLDGKTTAWENLQAALADHEASKYIYDQCLDDVRGWLKNYISEKTALRDWVPAMDQATNIDELINVIRDLVKQGLLDKEEYNSAVQQGFGAVIQERLQREGGILFLPEKPLKKAFNLSSFSRPTYYGIEESTQFARIVFESDVAAKILAGPRGHQLARKLGYHQTLIEWIVAHSSPASLQNPERSPLGIVQVSPGTISLAVSADKTVLSFGTTEMRILIAARDPALQLSPIQLSYANFLTKHYADYAREVPPLWEIREAFKVVAAARLLSAEGRAVIPDGLDTSWSPPSSVESEWDFAVIGLGPSQSPACGVAFAGGVDLQIQSHMRVGDLSEAEARELAASAHLGSSPSGGEPGRASGNALAFTPAALEVLDPADAYANLANLSGQELQSLRDQTMERRRYLEGQLTVVRKKEFAAQLMATAPADFVGWRDVVAEKLHDLPGVRLMEDLGKSVGQDMDRLTGEGHPPPPDWKAAVSRFKQVAADLKRAKELAGSGADLLDDTARRELNRLLDAPPNARLSAADISRLLQTKASDAEKRGRLITKLGYENSRGAGQIRVSAATVMWEAGAAYRAFADSRDWREGVVNAAPHIESVLKKMLPRPGELAGYARAAGEDATELTRFGSRATLFLKVGEAIVALAHETANIGIVNEGIRQDKNANRVLLMQISVNRAALEKRSEENQRLVRLIDQQRPGR